MHSETPGELFSLTEKEKMWGEVSQCRPQSSDCGGVEDAAKSPRLPSFVDVVL